jgi:hypothetical protein
MIDLPGGRPPHRVPSVFEVIPGRGVRRRWRVGLVPHVAAVAVLLAVGGCGGQPAAPAPRPQAADAPLPPIDPTTAIAVDDGRITVAAPAGWNREPRSRDCLVRYSPGGSATYPTITVLAAEVPGGITGVTAEQHDALVAAVAEDLAKTFTRQGQNLLLRQPAALRLGPHFAVTWAAPSQAVVDGIKQRIDRDCTAVVIDGRLYTVEARAPKGKIDAAGRAAARSVAANLAAVGAEPVASDPEPAPAAAEPASPGEAPPPPAAE